MASNPNSGIMKNRPAIWTRGLLGDKDIYAYAFGEGVSGPNTLNDQGVDLNVSH